MAHVNEDVNDGWSRTLNLQGSGGQPGWALISPEGTIPWSHNGRLEPQALATALDTHLRRSPDLAPPVNHNYINVGYGVSPAALSIGEIVYSIESHCPPIPLGRIAKNTVIAFVKQRSEASIAHLRALTAWHGAHEDEGAVVVVVDGTGAHEVESWKYQLGLDFVLLPDPKGTITDRFRIGVWPTTITVNTDGIVSDVKVGLAPHRARDFVPGED
jgi:hypothetical protein